MFPTKTRSRAHRLATDFAAFAATADQSDWRVWTIHYPSRKTEIGGLVADLKRFNCRINSVLGQLRKHCEFELLIIGIHIDWDRSTGLFDIHAHVVCKIPGAELREDAPAADDGLFPGAHPRRQAKTPHGFAIYASRTFKLSRVVRWRSEAVVAAWNLINHSPRYVRTGGAFAEWRKRQRALVDVHQQQAARKKRENRKATRYQGAAWEHRDRPLVRKIWKNSGDENVVGTLFRSARGPLKGAGAPSAAAANRNPPAFVDTTQSLPSDRRETSARQVSSASAADAAHFCEFTPAYGLAAFRSSIGSEVYRCNSARPLQVTPARSDHMTMPYITRAEVHNAADRVDAAGRKPTAKTVRGVLERGSITRSRTT